MEKQTNAEKLIQTTTELTLAKVEKLIVEEILIARKEGTATSRLTSLIMNIKKIK